MIREKMDQSEREYIERTIIKPIEKDLDKITLFENMHRAKLMLESAIGRLNFEKDRYEIRLDITKHGDVAWEVSVSARPKDCEEKVSVTATVR